MGYPNEAERRRSASRTASRSRTWYADFRVGDEHVVVFAGRIFRYHIGDDAGRNEAVEYGLAAGTPPHQLDWGE